MPFLHTCRREEAKETMKLVTLYLPEPYIQALDRLVNEQFYPWRRAFPLFHLVFNQPGGIVIDFFYLYMDAAFTIVVKNIIQLFDLALNLGGSVDRHIRDIPAAFPE